MPDNNPYTGTAPYYQCLVLPLTLSAGVAPTLKPIQARELIVDAAAIRYSQDVEESRAAAFEARYEKGWKRWLWALQAQYRNAFSSSATNPNAIPARYRFGYGRPFWRGFRN